MQDETLCSIITCLFANLHVSTASDVLEQSMAIVKRAHAQASSIVEISLCQEVKMFVEGVVEKEQEKDADEMKADRSATSPELSGQKFERFLHELVLALLDVDRLVSARHTTHASDTETLRFARTQMGLKLSQVKTISLATRGVLSKVFDGWLENERSKPLRELIVQAVQINKTAIASVG